MVNVMNSLSLNSQIDQNNYIESLIRYCFSNKIISYEEMNKIFNKLLELLHYKCRHYNSLVSTMKIDKLRSINESNMFTLGLYLKKYSIYDGVNILLNDDIFSLYNKSYSNLNSYINKTKMFYKVVFLRNMISTSNYYYNGTLNDGVKYFFKLYNSSYNSNDIKITADYECALERPNLSGIEFINKYLEYLNYENVFCRRFNYRNIDMMLKKKYIKYEELVINIFSDVFLISLLLRYLDKDIYSLNIDLIDLNKIYNDSIDIVKFRNKIYKCFLSIKEEFKFSKEVNNYLDKYYSKAIKTIIYFIYSKELEKLVGNNSVVII